MSVLKLEVKLDSNSRRKNNINSYKQTNKQKIAPNVSKLRHTVALLDSV